MKKTICVAVAVAILAVCQPCCAEQSLDWEDKTSNPDFVGFSDITFAMPGDYCKIGPDQIKKMSKQEVRDFLLVVDALSGLVITSPDLSAEVVKKLVPTCYGQEIKER